MTNLCSVGRIEIECGKNIWKKNTNKENAWDQKTEIDIVEGSMEELSLGEITSAIKKMKLGKASGLSEVSMEMINKWESWN